MFYEMKENLYEIIDKYNINIVNTILIVFTVVILVMGGLMTLVEPMLPAFIKQSYRYGKHCYKGPKDNLVSKVEVPKSWFAHFYIFALSWSIISLYLVLKGIIMHSTAPQYVVDFLDFMAGGVTNRKVLVTSNSALIASVLMTLQCGRRFYETNFVQIFSKTSKINFSHYMVGYIHYFVAILALLANTEGFVKGVYLVLVLEHFNVINLLGSVPSTFSFGKISIIQYICIFLFHYSWSQQYKANMILVNLRKDCKTGEVVTEKHLMPTGGFFELVSSPHMFFEIAMYIVLLGLVGQSFTWKLVILWVLSNQVSNSNTDFSETHCVYLLDYKRFVNTQMV